ncbi:triose-phosphate transporter [Chloropicon primus]|uniref:Triose-phosphate transporter n=1 Tax=Chloropicon primus TaxID=1764295 RepID=A0A5B8MCT7_9CHLO|nr:triose-phosphate transporter [Chloropicon primus]UPQ97119.1 triose-phosphate transporter [Chloropicon primus]|eukprot:QDZ17904.1 triose-phosphate transporter [Chloropicon primus]
MKECFQALKTFGLILNWILASAGLILFNKWLLSSGHFPYPVTLTLFHQAFCALVAFVALKLNLFECATMDRKEYLKGVVPIGALYAMALWFGNWAYMYLQVSYVQMLKAFMPAIVFAIGIVLGTEKFDWKLLWILLWIAFGVLVASFGEVNFSVMGTVIQLSSLAFEATRLTLLQLLLQRKFNPMTAMYYLSPITACFLFVLCLAKESSSVVQAMGQANPYILLLNCFCAFVLNIAVFLLIGKTSALTMNVSGVVKDWLIILSSVLIFKSTLTELNVIGFTIAFTGVLFYNFQRRRKKEEEQAQRQVTKGADEENQQLSWNPKQQQESE